MNGLWRKFFVGSWKVGVLCPHLVRKLWTTVENKCSNRSCTQKMGLGTHFSSTNHEYPVEKKISDACKRHGENHKKFHNPWRDCGEKSVSSWASLRVEGSTHRSDLQCPDSARIPRLPAVPRDDRDGAEAKKSPQSMNGLWRKLRVILLFQFFQILLQNEIDILRNRPAIVISVLSYLFQNIAVDGYADFFL